MQNTTEQTQAGSALLYDAIFGIYGVVSGLEIIERCMATARTANHADAPFPLDAEQAAIWHKAQHAAFSHVLEMISIAAPVLALKK